MVWHGVNCTKETREPLAGEVLCRDRHGYRRSGESYPHTDSEPDQDAIPVSNCVAAHLKCFDLQRLGLAGHSVGIGLAAQVP
jgi:hypothetical protein